MGRWSYSNRSTEQESLCLSTTWLKKHGYFCGRKKHGGITWKNGLGEESSISFTVDNSNDAYIVLSYTVGKNSDSPKYMNYSFNLIQVHCNLGGFRWAFQCSLSLNYIYCGRNVYKLYKAPNSDYFGCRHCMRIVYESQRRSRSLLEYLGSAYDASDKLRKIYNSIHKWHYKGRPTRKVIRLERLLREKRRLSDLAIHQTDLLLGRKQA